MIVKITCDSQEEVDFISEVLARQAAGNTAAGVIITDGHGTDLVPDEVTVELQP